MDSLISIIVPIYNAEKYLSECIESILCQTYKNIQLILINDGSTDNSLDICNYYKAIDNRILVIDKPNEGVSATRNLGIKLAEGEYIGFVDSDDYIEENMYEVLLNQIENDKSQVCVMISYTINSFEKYKSIYKNKMLSGNEALKYLLQLRFPSSVCVCLYSKDVIKNCRSNEEIHFFEDFELNYKILSRVKRVSISNQRLYNYRVNEGSINRREINDKRITCLKIYEIIIKNLEKKNRELFKYTLHSRAHFLISVIASLSKSKDADDKYYNIVHKNAKEMLWDVMFSRFVPIKYKAAILMCSVNPYLLCKILYLIRYKKQT
ncbi:MAG: glycosyl transferase [Firmicutes bacterium HGW-Firmicutes-7]|nr:MAG: glycosyl transferase [Firmicutes bacterium HGW-Firmicutes-7]